jgi:hypothetical protein
MHRGLGKVYEGYALPAPSYLLSVSPTSKSLPECSGVYKIPAVVDPLIGPTHREVLAEGDL